MRGNSHVRFLGGWRVVTLTGYPVPDAQRSAFGAVQEQQYNVLASRYLAKFLPLANGAFACLG